MNRRNFVGALFGAAIAAIIPVQGCFTKKQEFEGESFNIGDLWNNQLALWVPSGLEMSEFADLQMQLISRAVTSHMHVRFRFTRNPIRLIGIPEVVG